jgi:ribosomal protein S18 acetylase RimI-like enzyme
VERSGLSRPSRRSNLPWINPGGDDNVPAGFLVARRVPGRDERPDAELLNIAVIKAVQSQGLAQLLMKPFIDWCHAAHVDRIWLEVRASNHSAIKFYSKNGFVNGRYEQTIMSIL